MPPNLCYGTWGCIETLSAAPTGKLLKKQSEHVCRTSATYIVHYVHCLIILAALTDIRKLHTKEKQNRFSMILIISATCPHM